MADNEPAPNAELARLSEEFFQVKHSADPFSATLLGAPGFDGLVPDPSRAGADATAGKLPARHIGVANEEDGIGCRVVDQAAHAKRHRPPQHEIEMEQPSPETRPPDPDLRRIRRDRLGSASTRQRSWR